MVCPRVFAGEGVYGPGAITAVVDGTEDQIRWAELPTATLLSDACLLPGAQFAGLNEVPRANQKVGGLTFERKIRRGLTDAGLALPELEGVQVTAGPGWHNVRRVTLEIPSGWIRTLDEQRLAQNLSSCYVRPECVKRIAEHRDKVVNSALVAETLVYRFFDADERALDLRASSETQPVRIEVKGRSANDASQQTSFSAPNPVVIGVSFIRDAVISAVTPCSSTVAFATNGNASVTISGGGKSGAIPLPRTAISKLGQPAEVSAAGAERSECGAGSETRSEASARAFVRPVADNELSVETSFSTQGGHYRTVDACIAGRPIGFHGNDTTAITGGTVDAELYVIVRESGRRTLQVRWSDFLEHDGITTRLWVRDGFARPLVDGTAISGSGERRLEITDAGVYAIRAQITASLTRTGAGGRATAGSAARLVAQLLE
jgi:hypothetical protein